MAALCAAHERQLWRWVAAVAVAFGRKSTFSVVEGRNLTDHFPLTEYRTPADAKGHPASLFRHQSGGRSLIFGWAMEAQLSFEAGVPHQALKNELHFEELPAGGASTKTVSSYTAVRTWQFAVPVGGAEGDDGRRTQG